MVTGDPEADRDEAMGRLGGPSKLRELEEKLADLELRLDQKDKELEESIERNRVHVGRRLWPASAPTTWHDEAGTMQYPTDQCVIEGIGSDWCVIRSPVTSAVYFAAVAGGDIRADIANAVMD